MTIREKIKTYRFKYSLSGFALFIVKAKDKLLNRLKRLSANQWMAILTLIIASAGIWTGYESTQATKATVQMANEQKEKTDIELSPSLFLNCDWYITSKGEKPPKHAYAYGMGMINFISGIKLDEGRSKKVHISKIPPKVPLYYLTNYGRSPAFNIRIPYNYIIGTSFTEMWDRPPQSRTDYISIPALAPGETYKFAIMNIIPFHGVYFGYKILDTVSMTTFFHKNFEQHLSLGDRCDFSRYIILFPVGFWDKFKYKSQSVRTK